MLYTETVEERTLDLIKKLCQDPTFDKFHLVGGTALSLQIGHRKSIDIDLFTDKGFDAKVLAKHIENSYDCDDMKTLSNGVFCYIEDIKVDLISHSYDWLNPPTIIDDVRMASLDDIAAMKMNAIVGSGTRLKDFVDVKELLEHRSMEDMLRAYEAKYPDSGAALAKQAVQFHGDIDFSKQQEVNLLGKVFNWDDIVVRLKEGVQQPKKVFKQEKQEGEVPKQENKQNQEQGQGRKR